MTVPETIRAAITRWNMTQRETAQRLGVGAPYLSDVLGGRRVVTPQLAIYLERVLRLDATWILATQAQEQSDKAGAKGEHGCTKRCAGGQFCVLDSAVYHLAHCCAAPSCDCHAAPRQESPAMARRRARSDEKAKQVESCTRIHLLTILGRFLRNGVAA